MVRMARHRLQRESCAVDDAASVVSATPSNSVTLPLSAVPVEQLLQTLNTFAERSLPSRAHRVKVSKLDIGTADDLDEWFLTLEAECDAQAIQDCDRLEALRLNLGIQATREFQGAPANAKTDYIAARNWFHSEFGPQTPLVHYYSLLTATKGMGGTVAAISQRLTGLRNKYERAAERLGETDRQLKDDAMVHFLLEALTPAASQRLLAVHRHSPLTYVSAVKLAANYEKDFGVGAVSTEFTLLVAQQRDFAAENRQLKEQVTALLSHLQSGGPISTNNTQRRCFRCGQLNHLANQCRNAPARPQFGTASVRNKNPGPCHRCGKKGHYAFECRAPAPVIGANAWSTRPVGGASSNASSSARRQAQRRPQLAAPQVRYPNLTWPKTAPQPSPPAAR